MTLTQKKFIGFALGAMLVLLLSVPVILGFAQETNAQALKADDLFGGELKGTTSGYTTGAGFASAAGLGSGNLIGTITSIIRVALGFLGIIAVVIILLGGFKFMTSKGETTKVAEAKKLIFAGILGLVIILSAYAIASFVITQIATVNSGPGTPATPAPAGS